MENPHCDHVYAVPQTGDPYECLLLCLVTLSSLTTLTDCYIKVRNMTSEHLYKLMHYVNVSIKSKSSQNTL